MIKQSQKIHFSAVLFLFWINIFIILFCRFSSGTLHHQDYLAISMSGSGRAVTAENIQNHMLNPASLIYPQSFQISSFYSTKNISETKKFSTWGISIIENQAIPIAISYIKQRETKEQYIHISTASFLAPSWSLGLSLSHWKKTKTDSHWNIHTGFLIQPLKSPIAIGITADNLLPIQDKNKKIYGIGIVYTPINWIQLRTDTTYDYTNTWKYMGGIKISLHNFFILKTGIIWNSSDKKSLFSGSVELKSPNISVEYSLKQNNTKKQYIYLIQVQLKMR